MIMEKITQEELNVILDKHNKYLNDEKGGKRADLYKKDCSGLDFSNNDLRGVCLDDSNLTKANLSNCNLSNCDLDGVKLSEADLTGAILKNARLKNANLTNVKGLISTEDYMNNNFEFDEEKNGYIVYKTFGSLYKSPKYWIIKENSIIEENCDIDRKVNCSYGINCGTLDWVRDFNEGDNLPIWKMLIKKEWLNGVVVPYGTDGKFRCSKALLLNIVE